MELRMTPYQLPEKISFNFDELKSGLLEKAKGYECMVYTDDQITAAKADRAALNKLKKALNDERIKREREYNKPFLEFKGQIAEIISIIDRPITAIDRQIKSFEEQQKAEKREKIEEYWNVLLQAEKVPAGVCFSHIFDEKWLNASVSMKAIHDAIDGRMTAVSNDLDVIRELPFYAFEAEQVYLSTLDLSKAVSEAHRLQAMAEKKAAHEAEKAKLKEEIPQTPYGPDHIPEKPVDAPKQWISFKALLSVDEAKALREFFDSHNIEFAAL